MDHVLVEHVNFQDPLEGVQPVDVLIVSRREKLEFSLNQNHCEVERPTCSALGTAVHLTFIHSKDI